MAEIIGAVAGLALITGSIYDSFRERRQQLTAEMERKRASTKAMEKVMEESDCVSAC